MIPIYERRTTYGIAIVTERSAAHLKQKYQDAGISSGVYAVQEQNGWPPHREPLLLDSVGMPSNTLIDLLTHPPGPFIAMADRTDLRALRLLSLCPAVRLVCADEPRHIGMWLGLLEGMVFHRENPTIWMVPPPPPLDLDPLLLPILQALRTAPSFRRAMQQSGIPKTTMSRVIRATKQTLGLHMVRLRPNDLAAAIVEQLASHDVVASESY